MVNESCCVFANNGAVVSKVFLLFIPHFFEREVTILCVVQFNDNRLDRHVILF
jgi:hypothetical protein